MTKTARLRDNIAALAALRFDQAQIVDGHVINAEAAAMLLNAVQVHVRALLMCAPRPTPAPVPPALVDPATMTDADLHAHYRRTAPVEDLRFFLRHACLSDDLRIKAEALDARGPHGMTRAAWYRELATLHQQWRRERHEAERMACQEAGVL